MKINLKKIAIALATLGITSISYADNGFSGLGIKIEPKYVEFSNNGTTYAKTNTNNEFNVDSGYEPGFTIGLIYHLLEKDSDIELDYTHLHNSQTSSVNGNNLWVVGGGSTLGPADWVQGKTTYNYDSLDLRAGHTVKLSPTFDMGYYGGLNYSRFEREIKNQGMNSAGTTMFVNETGSTFRGIGPEFGMNGECHPFQSDPRFSVVGGIDTKFLYGDISSYSRTNNDGTHSSIGLPDENVVIPAVGANLGIKYDWDFAKMKLGAGLGYEAVEYFNVFRDSTTSTTKNNGSWQGAYIGVRAQF